MDTAAQDDRSLVEAVRRGDPAGLEGVYRRYADRLHTYARAMVHEPEAAADALHDAFLVAGRRMDQLRDPDRLRPWLYAIVRNECLRHLREGARSRPLADADDPVADLPDPGAGVNADQVRALVHAAAASLSPGDREVVHLAIRHDLSSADIGAALGLPANHAHARLSRARSQLERALGALLVARSGARDCPALADLVAGWQGPFTPTLRKRVARHVDDCQRCGLLRREQLSPAALLSAYTAPAFLVAADATWPSPTTSETAGTATDAASSGHPAQDVSPGDPPGDGSSGDASDGGPPADPAEGASPTGPSVGGPGHSSVDGPGNSPVDGPGDSSVGGTGDAAVGGSSGKVAVRPVGSDDGAGRNGGAGDDTAVETDQPTSRGALPRGGLARGATARGGGPARTASGPRRSRRRRRVAATALLGALLVGCGLWTLTPGPLTGDRVTVAGAPADGPTGTAGAADPADRRGDQADVVDGVPGGAPAPRQDGGTVGAEPPTTPPTAGPTAPRPTTVRPTALRPTTARPSPLRPTTVRPSPVRPTTPRPAVPRPSATARLVAPFTVSAAAHVRCGADGYDLVVQATGSTTVEAAQVYWRPAGGRTASRAMTGQGTSVRATVQRLRAATVTWWVEATGVDGRAARTSATTVADSCVRPG
ncbi:sigma-70 family RNA polymerase sigma factor [Micromonospora sp. SH-82]|uniref:RNA polymerase sigma factor n=1 Tax=Micromonospora sp. SH-82 TaxID=3132938 RepID=UPI003EBFA182